MISLNLITLLSAASMTGAATLGGLSGPFSPSLSANTASPSSSHRAETSKIKFPSSTLRYEGPLPPPGAGGSTRAQHTKTRVFPFLYSMIPEQYDDERFNVCLDDLKLSNLAEGTDAKSRISPPELRHTQSLALTFVPAQDGEPSKGKTLDDLEKQKKTWQRAASLDAFCLGGCIDAVVYAPTHTALFKASAFVDAVKSIEARKGRYSARPTLLKDSRLLSQEAFSSKRDSGHGGTDAQLVMPFDGVMSAAPKTMHAHTRESNVDFAKRLDEILISILGREISEAQTAAKYNAVVANSKSNEDKDNDESSSDIDKASQDAPAEMHGRRNVVVVADPRVLDMLMRRVLLLGRWSSHDIQKHMFTDLKGTGTLLDSSHQFPIQLTIQDIDQARISHPVMKGKGIAYCHRPLNVSILEPPF